MTYDLIIIGGGIGGSALACIMADAGWDVLVLEKQPQYEDRVRGEWIAPWGVVETQTLGLYDLLVEAGGHHITSHVTYDEALSPEFCEAEAIPLGLFPDVPGPLAIGHPHHCETLFNEATRRGADCRRPVDVTEITLGATPTVSWREADVEVTAAAPLIVGAEGRNSEVREKAGIKLQLDKPHHWFAGLLVEGVKGIDDTRQSIGTEGEFGFLAFPQGREKVRVYGGYPLDQRGRFRGDDGAQKFLNAFRFESAPLNEAIVDGTPAGPLHAYFNHDSWTEAPSAEGAVLIGDAAGWNDPINGLGLSITYRDVRMVSDALKASMPGAKPDFRDYAIERSERMRRLRFAGHLQAMIDMEFGDEAKARRVAYLQRRAADPTVGIHGTAILAGPETVEAEFFTEAHKAFVMEGHRRTN